MSRILKSTVMVVLALACSYEMVQAEPIIYTLSGTGSGMIGASSFTNEAFTITATADTSNVMQNGGGGTNSFVETDNYTISVNGHTMAIGVYETLAIGSSPSNGGELAFTNANYTMSPNVILGLAGSDVGNYNLTGSFTQTGADTPFGEFNGTAASGILTNEGRFLLTSAPTDVTFSAVVPEPTSVVMLGTAVVGGLAVYARRRRRVGASSRA